MNFWNAVFWDSMLARFKRRRDALGDVLISEGDNPGTTYLMQALAVGQISRYELQAISEHSPRFFMMLRDGLNLTTAQLHKMAADGFLTRDVIERAMR